jgi:gamma-glutamylaminecyclotransferase
MLSDPVRIGQYQASVPDRYCCVREKMATSAIDPSKAASIASRAELFSQGRVSRNSHLETPVALVFVYGTLKRGFPLFYIAQQFYGPVMLDKPGEGLQVHGELFEVAEERLPTLDELESVGSKGSFRSTVEVEPVGGGLRVHAIGFMKDESWLEPLHSDCISDYQDRRFVPAWKR